MIPLHSTTSLRLTLLLASLSAPALAAPQIWEVDPLSDASLGPGAGFVVESVGDLDGDGVREGLISSITEGSGRGRVYAVSSATGATILTMDGPMAGDAFGHSIAGLGDVNGDGVADIAVGAPATTPGRPGAVSVHSGTDGAMLWQVNGEANRDSFGWVVANAGDLNGDGVDDVGACAPGHDVGGVTDSGRVYLLSGADGALIRTHSGDTVNGFLGASCGGCGDVNADGVPDYVACALGTGANGTGEATVFSGADGGVLWSISAGGGARQYGNYFSGGAGDVNADGTPDVYVIDYQNVGGRGRLFVYSGVDGSTLHSIRGPAGSRWVFGRVRIGDLNGDGHDDLLLCSGLNDVGGTDAGAVYLFSGATGESLGQLTSDLAGRGVGTDCVSVGDVDGDGTEDVFVGVGTISPGQGGAYVLPTRPAPPVTYCDGVINSSGASAELSYRGSLALASTTPLTLDLQGLPANSLFIAFGGPVTDSTPIGDGLRCVASPASRLGLATATGAGAGELAATIPTTGAAGVIVGSPWHVQAWYRDAAGAGSGFNLSSALRLSFR